MPMGRGIWLNPETMSHSTVMTHEHSLKDAEVLDYLNVPDHIRRDLAELDPVKDSTEIRVLGVKAGLVRIRDTGREVVAQFKALQHRVRNILWSIRMVLEEIPEYAKAWQVRIHNLEYNDSTVLSFNEFRSKLDADESILMKEEINVTNNKEAIDKLITEMAKKMTNEGQ
jgi:hypothetical protein